MFFLDYVLTQVLLGLPQGLHVANVVDCHCLCVLEEVVAYSDVIDASAVLVSLELIVDILSMSGLYGKNSAFAVTLRSTAAAEELVDVKHVENLSSLKLDKNVCVFSQFDVYASRIGVVKSDDSSCKVSICLTESNRVNFFSAVQAEDFETISQGLELDPEYVVLLFLKQEEWILQSVRFEPRNDPSVKSIGILFSDLSAVEGLHLVAAGNLYLTLILLNL